MYCDEREGKRDRGVKKKDQQLLRSYFTQMGGPSIY